VVTHCRNDAFYGSALQSIVDAPRADRLVIAGCRHYFVVESTARHASDCRL